MANIVKNQYFEDAQGDISFFYTGKSNIIGLPSADAVIDNDRNAKYVRVATITFDTTLQSTQENIIDELLRIGLYNQISAQYENYMMDVHITAHVTGQRITKTKTKLIFKPYDLDDNYNGIYLTEEQNGTNYIVGLWVDTRYYDSIVLWRVSGSDRTSAHLNEDSFDRSYYLNLLKNEDKVYDVDTTNVFGTINANLVMQGTHYLTTMESRLKRLEQIQYPDIRFCTLATDTSWVPETENATAMQPQRLTINSVDYSLSLSSAFVEIKAGSIKGFVLPEPGLYMIQVINRFDTKSATKDSVIQVYLTKDDDIIPGTEILQRLLADNGKTYANNLGLSNGMVLVHSNGANIFRLMFKFLENPQNGVINEGTRIQVMKLLDQPAAVTY